MVVWTEQVWEVRGKRSCVHFTPAEDAPVNGTVIYSHGLFAPMVVEDASPGLVPFFERVVSPLGERDLPWRVIRFDARGHGESERADEAWAEDWSTLAKDIWSIYEEAKKHLTMGDRLILAGLSMGVGASIHAFCNSLPHKVDGLVLIIPPNAWELRNSVKAGYLKSLQTMRDSGTAAFLQKMTSSMKDTKLWPGLSPRALLQQLEQTEQTNLEFLLAAAGASDFPPREVVKRCFEECGSALLLDIYTSLDDPGHPFSISEELHAMAKQSGCISTLHLLEDETLIAMPTWKVI
jgi:pimeloyl-ACP methyl ester carboxylesterase